MTHGEPLSAPPPRSRLSPLRLTSPVVVCSLQLLPAQGGLVPRKALHFGELPVFLLVGAAEGHEGNGRVFRLRGPRPDQKPVSAPLPQVMIPTSSVRQVKKHYLSMVSVQTADGEKVRISPHTHTHPHISYLWGTFPNTLSRART